MNMSHGIGATTIHKNLSSEIPRKGPAGMIWQKDDFTISSNKDHVNVDILHDMLSRSYWAKDRSREEIEKSIANSLCFSLFGIKDGYSDSKCR